MKNKERQKSACKSGVLTNLHTCKVVLSNIALDSHLVELYPKLGFILDKKKKVKTKSEESLCTDKSKSFFNNVYLSQFEQTKKETNVKDCIRTRNVKSGNKIRTKQIIFEPNDPRLETRIDVLSSSTLSNNSQPEFSSPRQQVTSDTSSEVFPSMNSDKTFILSTSTCSSNQTQSNQKQKTRVKLVRNIGRFGDIKSRLRCNASAISVTTNAVNENCLTKANLTCNDHSSKTQSMSQKFTIRVDNTFMNNVTNPTSLKEKHEEDQVSSILSNITDNSDVENEISANIIDENIRTKVLSNLSETPDKDEITKNKTKKSVIGINLPIIIADNIVPKGTIKIVRLNNKDQNNTSLKISKLISVEQNGCNDSKRDIKKPNDNDNVIASTNVLREKTYLASCEVNGSIGLKTSESILKLKNNINLKKKNPLKYRFKNKVICNRNYNDRFTKLRGNAYNNKIIANRGKRIRNYRYIKNRVRLNKLDINDNMPENDKSKDNTCNGTSNENIISKPISNLANTSEESDISEPFHKEAVNKNQKRLAETNIETLNLQNKKIKLDINSWLRNQTFTLKDHEQSNNLFNSTENSQSNNNIESIYKQTTDLREQLNRKRLNRLNFTSNNNNEICKKPSMEEKTIADKTFCEKEENGQIDAVNNYICPQDIVKETQCTNELDTNIHEDIDTQKDHAIDNEENLINNDDSDCISLFAKESFNESNENILLDNTNKSETFLQSDVPYEMSATMFDKYMKQNANEFNKEFARYATSSVMELDEKRKIFDKEILSTDSVTAQSMPLIKNRKVPFQETNFMNFIKGYCFLTLRKSTCSKLQECKFIHNIQTLIHKIYLQETSVILKIFQDALVWNFNALCEEIYVTSLSKLSVEQIFTMYKMITDTDNLESKIHKFKPKSRKIIIHNVIKELLKRHMSLKLIVDRLVAVIATNKTVQEFKNILQSVEDYIKPGEYWNTLKSLILELQSEKRIIHKVLFECIQTKNIAHIEDVNNTLMNKLDSALRSTLNEQIVQGFNNLLPAKDSYSGRIQTFEECTRIESIASPDSKQNADSPQTECSKKQDVSFPDEIDPNRNEKLTREETSVNNLPYAIQPIDDIPDARSVYREQTNLWKFYVDLDRFRKGLLYKDYDYVIDILKSYAETPDENAIFVRSCCSILRAEIKRSEYHLKQIIQRTVQMGTSGVLAKTFLDIGLNILNSLMDEEIPRLAFSLVQALKIYGLSSNAEFILLSAEIYLANNETLEALDLLKNNNIICTSRAKWYVESTINDWHIRNKILYILLDLLCIEFIEYAFFLFQFLIRDQSSQYQPIDLSRYVNKLITLSLSSKNTNLIREIANLILKYNFSLSTIPCRALVSTLIHEDEVLARQIYNYAEGIGIYSAVKLWPVIHIILNTDLTEEEIYLAFLQLLKSLKLNLGQGMEFAKPQNIKVYLFLEIKSKNEQYRGELHCNLQADHNNRLITNTKILIKNILRKRFDPPISLMKNSCKGRICRVQSTSLLNYLMSEHYNSI